MSKINLSVVSYLNTKPFLYGLAAIGTHGGKHVAQILEEEIINALLQIGAKNITELRQRLDLKN